MLEKHYRPAQVARISGYSILTIRKKLLRRELAYRKVGRIITIPESEVRRLLGELRPVVTSKAAQ